MSDKYEKQLEIEKLNKAIIENIINTVDRDSFIGFYISHNQKETMGHFGLRTIKQLTKVLKLFNYDFSTKKPSRFKGKHAARSHESYVAGGKKSAETQRKAWDAKSMEEKEAWSLKQSIAHTTKHYANLKAAQNRAYRTSLTPEEKARQDAMRSESVKAWWDSLSEEERDNLLQKRFASGSTYNQKDSKPNLEFKQSLEEAGIAFEREYCLEKKLFDFKVSDTLIEINPSFTHNSTFTPFKYNQPLAKNYHKLKSEIAVKNNFRCINVFDWDDKQKIISMLKGYTSTFYARNCVVKEITKKDSRDFLLLHHLQGDARAKVYLGLFNSDDELIAVMTFGTPRYNRKYEYELIRYCANAKIIGGSEKLFNYFIKQFNPKSILSYCDLSKFTGKTYEKLGFELLRKPTPGKHWYNIKTGEHYTDALLRQQGFSRLIHHCNASEDPNLPTKSNRDLMISNGFVEVYDCGQATFIWEAVEEK